MTTPLLDVRHVSKTFPGVRALDDVSLTVHSGEIVALLGHNGSGKSTLVKILAELHRADDGGEILLPDVDGAAEKRGRLHFIHQDLGLVPHLTTVENLGLSERLGFGALLPSPVGKEKRRALALINEFGVHFDVLAPVAQLTPAERTVVAIARAMNGWTSPRNVLLLDEPTAALHGKEVAKLFRAIRRVARRGAGVVFISHRLDEVVELADRVVILRSGKVVAIECKGEFDHTSLVKLIVGHAPSGLAETERRAGAIRLSVQGLSGPKLDDVSLAVRSGEIVGVSGLLGSGREHLLGSIYGALPTTSGRVTVDGGAVRKGSPAAAIARGFAFVPSDRHRHAAILSMNARENLTLPQLSSLRRRFGRLDGRSERAEADRWISQVGIVPQNAERSFSLFSGGNQQKIVLAKWLRTAPRVLLVEEPTQGVDVGARADVYRLIARAAADGAAVLVASSDTKELATICDRAVVLWDGRISAELSRTSLTEANLARATLGASLLNETKHEKRGLLGGDR